MAEILFCALTGVWLFAAGLAYRYTIKREYDQYGIPNWLDPKSDAAHDLP